MQNQSEFLNLIDVLLSKFDDLEQKDEVLAKFQSDSGFEAVQRFSNSKNRDVSDRYQAIMEKFSNFGLENEIQGDEM